MEPRSFEHGDGKKPWRFSFSNGLGPAFRRQIRQRFERGSHFLQSLDAGTGRAHFPEQIFMAGANDGR